MYSNLKPIRYLGFSLFLLVVSCGNSEQNRSGLAPIDPNNHLISGKLLALYLEKLRLYSPPIDPVDIHKLRAGIKNSEKIANLPRNGLKHYRKNLYIIDPITWKKMSALPINKPSRKKIFEQEKARIAKLSQEERTQLLDFSNPQQPQEPLIYRRMAEVQQALSDLGFYSRKVDGIWGKFTEKAVSRLQSVLNYDQADGRLTGQLADEIVRAALPRKLPKNTAIPGSKSHRKNLNRNQRSGTQTTKRIIKRDKFIPKLPKEIDISNGLNVYAIEKVECEGPNGGSALVYEGAVKTSQKGTADVLLNTRYRFRFHPRKTGISRSNWWCVPKRKVCYSQVKFIDWKGKNKKGDSVTFKKTNIFPSDLGLIMLGNAVNKKCNL